MAVPFALSLIFLPLTKKYLSSTYFKQTFGVLYLDFKQKHAIFYMYHWTFLLRRLILVCTLIYDADDGMKQVELLQYSAIFILMWHVVLRPFKDKFVNMIVMINEMLLIGIAVIC